MIIIQYYGNVTKPNLQYSTLITNTETDIYIISFLLQLFFSNKFVTVSNYLLYYYNSKRKETIQERTVTKKLTDISVVINHAS